MQLIIKDKQYNVKYTIRSLFIFEQITGKPFEIKTLLDNYVFFYSMILANNPDTALLWDDFIDAIDGDAKLVEQLNKIVEDYQKKDNLFTEEESDPSKKN